MSKVVILFASVHHQNTEKVVDYVASCLKADCIDILKTKDPNIDGYEFVVLASGIYFNTFHKSILDYVKNTSFAGKKTILLYTCGIPYRNYATSLTKQLVQMGAKPIGRFHCRGFDTYGPLKKIGGIAKNHPNQMDMDKILVGIKKAISENM